jgi:hypothetical protein
MKRLAWALLVLLVAAATAVGSLPDAVVRLPTHGASGTVIATGKGWSLVLTCAHAFEGTMRFRPVALDVPTPATVGVAQRVGVFLVALDKSADLALLWVGAGPLAYVAPVAPAGQRPGRLVSVGYDNMTLPARAWPATWLGANGATAYTRERPGHGRSGGALLDIDHGCLVGVVLGYETGPGGRGLYAR